MSVCFHLRESSCPYEYWFLWAINFLSVKEEIRGTSDLFKHDSQRDVSLEDLGNGGVCHAPTTSQNDMPLITSAAL